MSFAVQLPVRFADCDPAGIAYYPRLLALADAAVEDWTAATLGLGRAELHHERRLGLPTVKLESSFHTPARLGDRLSFQVTVEALGTSSVTLAIVVDVAGTRCLDARLVQVLTDLARMAAVPWPANWRAALQSQILEISG